jgi:hypothetical protein
VGCLEERGATGGAPPKTEHGAPERTHATGRPKESRESDRYPRTPEAPKEAQGHSRGGQEAKIEC